MCTTRQAIKRMHKAMSVLPTMKEAIKNYNENVKKLKEG